MLKKFVRCISTFLVLVLLVNMVPVQALGDLQTGNIGQIDGTEQIETDPAGSSSDAAEASIIAEIPEGRSEYSKVRSKLIHSIFVISGRVFSKLTYF